MSVEDRLVQAFRHAHDTVQPSPDLFARVSQSVEADRERRQWRWHVGLRIAAFVGALAALGALGSQTDNGRIIMPWWLLELISTIVLVAIALVLGPFIKRFGRSYAADVFRANPRTGKSYLVLTDVAYYLIFTAYIMFSARFEPEIEWLGDVTADQVQQQVVRVGGILLLLGILHGANIVMLPVIGRLLSLNRKLDEHELERPGGRLEDAVARGPGGSLGPGTWLLRIEPAPAPAPPPAPPERPPLS